MTAFPRLDRIVPVLSLLLFVLGGCAVLIAFAAPYLGLGVKEGFFLYRLVEWSRTDLLQAGIIVGLAGLVLALLAGLVLALPDLMQRTHIGLYLGNVLGQIRTYFAIPPVEQSSPFHPCHQKILPGAAVLFQTIYLFIIPLGFECDAAMYLKFSQSLFGAEGGAFNYYRAPGFPIFLGLSGQLLFGSFIPTVAVQAAMGILSPLLFYRTLAPINCRAAFITACVFVLSTAPFYGAKIMLPEQVFAFLIVAGLYGFSRYYFTRDVRFIHLSLFCFFAATFTRWEANPLLFMGIVLLFFIARARKHHLRHLALAVSVLAGLATGWSATRSHNVTGDMSLLGSFHHFAGRQSFWVIYWGDRLILEKWQDALGWGNASGGGSPANDDRLLENETFYEMHDVPFVRPENGPQTRKLRDLILEIVAENPDSYRALEPQMINVQRRPDGTYKDDYKEYFGRFDGNPEAFADNFFLQPNGFYTDYVPEELRKRLGLKGMNDLLGAVVLETMFAQPSLAAFLALRSASNFLSLFGIDMESVAGIQTPGKQTFRSSVFSFWEKNHYSDVYYNIGGCATAHLSPKMQQEIIRDHEVSVPMRDRLFPIGNFLRNLVRNVSGPIALLTCWFIPFAPNRRLFLYMALLISPYLLFSSSLGYSPYSRYEIAVQPLIIFLAFSGLLGLRCFLRKSEKTQA